MAKGAAKRGKQTGTKNTKAIGGRQKRQKITDPWGPIIPQKSARGANDIGTTRSTRAQAVRGSSMRKPTPDVSLRTTGVKSRDPLQWPVEVDTTNHTRQPSVSGVTSAVITAVNESVEQAYTRAGYQ